MKATTRKQESATIDQDEELVNAEAELLQLRQRYRIVENDRKAYLDESSNILRKQRNYIEKLQKEKAEFGIDMRLVKCLANKKRDATDLRTMSASLEACTEGDRQIEEEDHHLKLLDKKCARLKEGNLDQMRVQGGWNADMDRHVTSRRKIRTMENKLDKRTVSFNKALSTNHELRERIQQLRRELGLFNNMHKKKLKEQGALKDKMNAIIELSTVAYDSREECLARISTIRDRNDKDEVQYNTHIKDLKRVLAHEQRLKDFMNLKAKDRSDLLKAATEASKRKLAKSSKTCLHQVEVRNYETVFERLKHYYGEAVLDHLVHNFIEKEGVAFALFNYNSELECDVELTAQRNKTLKRDIEQFKAQGVQLEGERVQIMKTLEAKARGMTTSGDVIEARLKGCRKDLDQTFRRIVAFIRKLGCDETMVTNRLGCRGTINEANAMTYLGLAEFVCDDIFLVEAFHQHRRTVKNTSTKKMMVAAQQGSVITAKLRPKSPVAVSITPPSIGEDGEISEDMDIIASSSLDDTQPLSPGDIRSKVVKTIEVREMKKATTPKSDWKWQATTTNVSSTDVPIESGGKQEESPHPESAELTIHESTSSECSLTSSKDEF